MIRHLVVIPTYRPGAAHSVCAIRDALSAPGVEVVAVANSQSSLLALSEPPPSVLTQARNLGYGEAANFAARSVGHFDWIWIINDDLTLSPSTGMLEDTVSRVPSAGLIVVLPLSHPGPHAIPSAFHVLNQLSMIGPLSSLLRRRKQRSVGVPAEFLPLPRGQTAGFTFVGIRSDVWYALGGFCKDLALYFEDDDLMRRFWRLSSFEAFVRRHDYGHERSSTTRQYLAQVLPVAARSAVLYLTRAGYNSTYARCLVSTAFAVRTVSVPFHRNVDRVQEVRGIVRAISALIRDDPVSLPQFKD